MTLKPLSPQSGLSARSARRSESALRAASLGLRGLSALSPELSARAASVLFTSPRRFTRPEREQEWLRDATPFVYRVDGQKLRGYCWGRSGPMVALVHGWEGRGSQLGAFAEPLTNAGLRVVAFDAPGHGESDGRRVTPMGFARALSGVVQVTGPLMGVVAHSLGAPATALAMARGLSLERVVFVAPGAAPSRAPDVFGRMLDVDEEIVERLKARLAKMSQLPWSALEPERLFGRFHVPLLVLHDRDDDEVKLADVERLVEIWPGSKLLLTEALGYRRILRDEQVVEQAVRFLSD